MVRGADPKRATPKALTELERRAKARSEMLEAMLAQSSTLMPAP